MAVEPPYCASLMGKARRVWRIIFEENEEIIFLLFLLPLSLEKETLLLVEMLLFFLPYNSERKGVVHFKSSLLVLVPSHAFYCGS
ncbi:hypothetical protein LDENG_00092640 [Lucifuga dentata]|nr:hypothetical protein LDENG_00092640 [Lucifuga dentata]